MRKTIVAGSTLAVALLCSAVVAGDLKSGPQPGSKVRAFEPENVTGKFPGTKRCLV